MINNSDFENGFYKYFDLFKDDKELNIEGDSIVCPNCGKFYNEVENADYGEIVDEEYWCDNCEKSFLVTHEVEITTRTYSSIIEGELK